MCVEWGTPFKNPFQKRSPVLGTDLTITPSKLDKLTLIPSNLDKLTPIPNKLDKLTLIPSNLDR